VACSTNTFQVLGLLRISQPDTFQFSVNLLFKSCRAMHFSRTFSPVAQHTDLYRTMRLHGIIGKKW